MSIKRRCPICFQQENIRFNFGDDRESEKEFHSEKWCNCGYASSDEMMIDQDMGLTDPNWIPISKHFIEAYHSSIKQGQIHSSEELVRFFLKLLKSSANNIRKSIEIVDKKEGEEYKFIYHGKSDRIPRINIFEPTLFTEAISTKSTHKGDHKQISYKRPYSKAFIILTIVFVIGFIIGKLI